MKHNLASWKPINIAQYSARRFLFACLCIGLCMMTVQNTAAQPGGLDPQFYRQSVLENASGIGLPVVHASVLQSDGKLVIGGEFTSINGVPRSGIARLNANGSLDTSFDPGAGVSGGSLGGSVSALLVQPDGKIVVGGDFTFARGVARSCVARFLTNGVLDTSFYPGAGVTAEGFDPAVLALGITSDGKIVIGGQFSGVDGVACGGIARVFANGAVDTLFNPGVGIDDGQVYAIGIQSDNKIVVGGNFTSINGTNRMAIARFTTTGVLDSAFNTAIGVDDGSVNAIAVQSDGKIFIGGNFTSYKSIARVGVARLLSSGALDAAFDPKFTLEAGYYPTVNAIVYLTGGKVLIGGDFYWLNLPDYTGVVRLTSSGAVDSTFLPGTAPDYFVSCLAAQSNGAIYLGGAFGSINGVPRTGIGRLKIDGSVDTLFNPQSGPDNKVNATAVQSDGKLLLAGEFTTINEASRNGIARLGADGWLDTTFNPGTGVDSWVGVVALCTNGADAGKILIGGPFSTFNGVVRNGLARLTSSGALDTAFNAAMEDGSHQVEALAVQPDGKIVIGGYFYLVGGVPRNGIARLNSNGTPDLTFDPGEGIVGGDVVSMAIQANGQILVVGTFYMAGGFPRAGIARFNPDGSLDELFDPGNGVDGNGVSTIAIQPDGKILIGGDFTYYNTTSRNGIARLNPDGSIDTTFDPGLGAFQGAVMALAVDARGGILVGGTFANFDSIPCNNLVRLDTFGHVDLGFGPGAGIQGQIGSLSLTPDGKILAGGLFDAVNGTPCLNLAVLLGGTAVNVAPVITVAPRDVTVGTGDAALMTGRAYGSTPLFYQWRFKSAPIPGSTNGTLNLSQLTTNQTGAYTLVASNAYGSVTSAPAILTVRPPLPEQYFGTTGMVWAVSGNVPWFGQSSVIHNGKPSAQSGAIIAGQSSILKTTVQGPGVFRFWCKVSCNSAGGVGLDFSLDGVSRTNWTGEIAWQQQTLYLSAGLHVMQWTYWKTDGIASGSDAAWIGEASFVPGVLEPGITVQPTNQIVFSGDPVSLVVQTTGVDPLSYQWWFNNAPLPNATNRTLSFNPVSPANAGLYSLMISNPFGVTNSSSATLTVLTGISWRVALDATNLAWMSGGDQFWFGETNVTHDGVDAAQSGRVADSQHSVLQAVAQGPGALAFWWKVSSELNFDVLNFYIDGVLQTNISGEVDWQAESFYLPTGNHLLAWEYAKDGSFSTGLDAGWLDQVTFVPGAPAPFIIKQPESHASYDSVATSFDVVAAGAAPLTYQWRRVNVNLENNSHTSGVTNSLLVISNVQSADAGYYTVVVRNAYGSITSSPPTLLTVKTNFTVTFADPHLDSAVRAELPKPAGPLLVTDLLSLRLLSVSQSQIQNLSGLEYATNLQTLNLAMNQITNVTLLAGLTNLEKLVLSGNAISNLAPLSRMTRLIELDLGSNHIGNIDVLAGITNLTYLNLSGNTISNVSALAGLNALVSLNLQNNHVSDVAPLRNLTNLFSLILSDNAISNIGALSNLTLLNNLYIANNLITDLAPLANLPLLGWLDVSTNNISNPGPLVGLTNLRYLQLAMNHLDLASGSSAMMSIGQIASRGTMVIYVPQKAPVTNVHLNSATAQRLPDGRFQFTLSGGEGLVLEIQASTNLIQWDTLGWLTNATSSTPFTDPQNSLKMRFYRAKPAQ